MNEEIKKPGIVIKFADRVNQLKQQRGAIGGYKLTDQNKLEFNKLRGEIDAPNQSDDIGVGSFSIEVKLGHDELRNQVTILQGKIVDIFNSDKSSWKLLKRKFEGNPIWERRVGDVLWKYSVNGSHTNHVLIKNVASNTSQKDELRLTNGNYNLKYNKAWTEHGSRRTGSYEGSNLAIRHALDLISEMPKPKPRPNLRLV